MIGLINKTITVKQLYDYALQHNYINADAKVVLDIINRERNSQSDRLGSVNDYVEESTVNPINNTSTIDFNTLVEYTVEDLLLLFST